MMEPTLARVTELIRQFYQAAYDPAQWNSTIQNLRKLFDGSTACLTNHTTNKVATWAFSANPDYGYFQKYVEYFTQTNPFLDSLAVTPLGKIVPDTILLDLEKFRRSDFWNEWMKPQDMYDGLCCKLSDTADGIMFVDVRRGAHQTAFDSKDAELFGLLVPHVERASQISQQLRLANALMATFSRLPFGAILVNADMRILEMNDLAEILLDTDHGELTMRGGFLRAQPHILRELQKLTAEACGLHMNGLVGAGCRMIIETTTETGHLADYVLEIAPVFDSPFPGVTSGRCAMIVMKKIDMGNPDGFDDHIRAIFKLTRSEARLATLLAAGFSLKDAATEAGLKNSTARAYLERLFHKTATHQQSQLVALLKNAAPALLQNSHQVVHS
ncbi:hypothetical protein HB779_24755 (plasmid) [Phyllobacterium sp. 628]|uniref:helix-turn-helix transcriptional regulator n=1 Tax=Phyllobacterium sp. 628 TaxID=2718938 RepID=UPI001662279F|nr:hypothetical protein [Phyllobacterium sp. 628]QND55071.1 hypothetical protein HB779_24755 [Phyllobacterium sp. 628]